jgi:hypothetical protein
MMGWKNKVRRVGGGRFLDANLVLFINHGVFVGVKLLGLRVGDVDGLEPDVRGHVRVVLAVPDGRVELGGEGGDRVLVPDASHAEFDEGGTADPFGEVVARVLVGVGVKLGLGDGDVVVLSRDGQAERDLLGCAGGDILGKSRCSINSETLEFCREAVSGLVVKVEEKMESAMGRV